MFKKLLWLHRWLGISIGFYFVLLGLTGSFLVYRNTFQSWMYPQIRQASGVPGILDLPRIIFAAQKGLALEDTKGPSRVWVSHDPTRNVELGFSGLPGMERGVLTAFVDPATYEFKGKENFRETIGGKIFIFHHDFFLGRVGRTIMGITGVMMLVLLIGGIYLWWPRKLSWKKALRLGPTKTPLQMQLQLHKFIGFYSLVLMLVVTFSGVYLSRPDWFQSMPPRKPPEPVAESAFATFQVGGINSRLEGLGPKPWELRFDYRKMLIQVTTANGKEVYLKANSLEYTEPAPTAPKSMRSVQHDLHAGHFWGIGGEILIFVSGLLPAFFYFSGLYIWWVKRKTLRTKKKELAYASTVN